jgi:FMN-dependent NADH-azoreductase
LQSQLKDLKGPKKRKWVTVDPNTKFANVDLIKEAIGKAEKEEARAKAKKTKSRPERVSARKAKANISKSMYTEVVNLD